MEALSSDETLHHGQFLDGESRGRFRNHIV
jgi:hypothetical protein